MEPKPNELLVKDRDLSKENGSRQATRPMPAHGKYETGAVERQWDGHSRNPVSPPVQVKPKIERGTTLTEIVGKLRKKHGLPEGK